MNGQTKYSPLKGLGLVLMVAALVFGGLGLTGAAAQAAIPGDTLYGIKSTIEQTQLSLARDAGQRAELRLAFAEKRLQEIQALIAEGRYREVGQAALAFEADLHGAILELETISRLDPARASKIALEITSALTRFSQSLSAMAAGAPESVRAQVERALDTTAIASSLDLSAIQTLSAHDTNGNSNANENLNGNENENENEDVNANDNENENENVNENDNANLNENGDCLTVSTDGTPINGDDSCTPGGDDDSNSSNDNTSGGSGNTNSDDGGSHSGSNDNGGRGSDDSGSGGGGSDDSGSGGGGGGSGSD